MKTPMNVLTSMKKKKKNRKGFSLVELIVVLVIMAILAAALVPTLIGYIKQTRQSNAKNEASSCVSAAQTIASSAYAAGTYTGNGSGNKISLDFTGDVAVPPTGDKDSADNLLDEIETLAEVDGDLIAVCIGGATGTDKNGNSTEGKVVGLIYENDGTAVYYDGSTYQAGDKGDFTVSKDTFSTATAQVKVETKT